MNIFDKPLPWKFCPSKLSFPLSLWYSNYQCWKIILTGINSARLLWHIYLLIMIYNVGWLAPANGVGSYTLNKKATSHLLRLLLLCIIFLWHFCFQRRYSKVTWTTSSNAIKKQSHILIIYQTLLNQAHASSAVAHLVS